MTVHKKDVVLGELSTRQLRARRRRLVAALPDVADYLAGSLIEQSRRCGKAGCRCTRGALHESWVWMTREQGVQRLRVVPKDQTARWREWAEHYRRFRRARRELDRQYREVLRLVKLLESARTLAPPSPSNDERN